MVLIKGAIGLNSSLERGPDPSVNLLFWIPIKNDNDNLLTLYSFFIYFSYISRGMNFQNNENMGLGKKKHAKRKKQRKRKKKHGE